MSVVFHIISDLYIFFTKRWAISAVADGPWSSPLVLDPQVLTVGIRLSSILSLQNNATTVFWIGDHDLERKIEYGKRTET